MNFGSGSRCWNSWGQPLASLRLVVISSLRNCKSFLHLNFLILLSLMAFSALTTGHGTLNSRTDVVRLNSQSCSTVVIISWTKLPPQLPIIFLCWCDIIWWRSFHFLYEYVKQFYDLAFHCCFEVWSNATDSRWPRQRSFLVGFFTRLAFSTTPTF